MRRTVLSLILVGLAIAAGLAAAPASASPPHQCQDGERLVHGGVNPLLVTGTYCTVDSVNVGDQGATVSGGHLSALDSTFHGPVTFNYVAVLQMTRSTVDGSITSNQSGLQVTVLHSHIHGGIVGLGGTARASSQTVRDTIVDGDVNWGSHSTDHLFVTQDHIGGVLVSTHTIATIQGTTVGIGIVSVQDQGLQICNVETAGDLTVNGYAGAQPAYVGAYADPNTTCPQPVVSGGLEIINSKGPVYLGNVVVHGNLYCSGNASKPVVSPDVVVTGERVGQCS